MEFVTFEFINICLFVLNLAILCYLIVSKFRKDDMYFVGRKDQAVEDMKNLRNANFCLIDENVDLADDILEKDKYIERLRTSISALESQLEQFREVHGE